WQADATVGRFLGESDLPIVGDESGEIGIILASGERELVARHKGAIRALAVSPDGHRVLDGGDDGTIELSSTDPFDPVHRVLSGAHSRRVSALAFVDTRRALSAGYDGRIVL